MFFETNILNDIAANASQHARSSAWWKDTNHRLEKYLKEAFANRPVKLHLGLREELFIEDVHFGAVNASHLFGLDELIIFAWYQRNAQKYRRFLDLGANIGVHSLVMSKLGAYVTAYEPDPYHASVFEDMMKINGIKDYELRKRAIGDRSGTSDFIRVLGNTTGSHLAGSKSNPYGRLEIINVDVDDLRNVLLESYDLVKMDVENFEGRLITALTPEHFCKTDIMLEVGSKENAVAIYDFVISNDIHGFSQKNGWREIRSIDCLPFSHKEGSLFLTKAQEMNWER